MRFTDSRLARSVVVAILAAALVGALVASAGASTARSLAGKGKPPVVFGDKNFPEENILGDLYQQALENQGYKVTLKPNLGSTEIAFKALKSGQIQGYPEYDGTLLATVAGISKNPANAKAAYAETLSWLQKHGYWMSQITPFSDSDAIAVLTSYAKKNHLTSIGDLKKLGSAVKIGGAPEFQTRYPDGLLGLNRIYKVKPTFVPLNIPSFYSALDNGQVNAAAVFTTDPPLKSGKYTVLKDTKFIFGFQNVGMVVKSSVVKAEGPAFTATIDQVSSLLTQKAIIALNAAVEVDKQPAAAVAKAFLKANHMG